MLVKILDADPEFVDSLKLATGASTGSKAYVYAAERHADLRAQIVDLHSQNAALRRRLELALRTIQGARSAAALLLDHTGQLDFPDN
ncbi:MULTISPECIES: hypothetical protein [Pseudomonas syringae group]|uniref:Uncharacterized protein n=1 Tax=Pseudomonas syringae pv. coriandricola TaxID=264453 RepID=A0A3M3JDG7_9PSED|nr:MULTISPECIES: hypothetical protein [Pseudomonas syringae group]RMN08832.1 hypothetical protein ALQ65_200137 [Pseudomonas syringae pv. coriandricola]